MKAKLILKMTEYFSGDVRRINHFLKVYSFAKIIGELEGLDKRKQEIVEVSGIIHDVGIKLSEKKYFSSSGRYQEIEGPAIAEKFLKEIGYSEDLVSRVSFIVGNHHSYNKIDDIDFQILVEADFLVNIFEDEMDKAAIKKIEENIFKTKNGKQFFRYLYL